MAAEIFTFEWVKNDYDSGPPLIRTYPEGDTETFSKGTPVVYDVSEDGVVELARTAGVPDNQTMLGIALQDASGVSDTDIDVLIPRYGDVFSAVLASDEDTTVAPTLDNTIGRLYGLIKLSATPAAGTEYAIDTGNVNWVKVIDLDPRDIQRKGAVASLAAGDRVLCYFLGSILDSAGFQA